MALRMLSLLQQEKEETLAETIEVSGKYQVLDCCQEFLALHMFRA